MARCRLIGLPTELLVVIMRLCDAKDHLAILGIWPTVDSVLEYLYKRSAYSYTMMHDVFHELLRWDETHGPLAQEHIREVDEERAEFERVWEQLIRDDDEAPAPGDYVSKQSRISKHLGQLASQRERSRICYDRGRRWKKETIPCMVIMYMYALATKSLQQVLWEATREADCKLDEARQADMTYPCYARMTLTDICCDKPAYLC